MLATCHVPSAAKAHLQSLLDLGADGLHLGVGVHEAVASDLGVENLAADDLDFELARLGRSSFSGYFQLVRERLFKLRLETAELGGVPSGATVKLIMESMVRDLVS